MSSLPTGPGFRNTDARKITGRHELVLRKLVQHGPCTDFELAQHTGLQQTSIGKRRGECRDNKLVREALGQDNQPLRRSSPSGSQAQVWVITAKGIQWLQAHSEAWQVPPSEALPTPQPRWTLPPEPAAAQLTAAQRDAAQDEFTHYFVTNYPGPRTVISDPHWHAPKIFRAALRAIEQAKK
jgi:hypothetical protein